MIYDSAAGQLLKHHETGPGSYRREASAALTRLRSFTLNATVRAERRHTFLRVAAAICGFIITPQVGDGCGILPAKMATSRRIAYGTILAAGFGAALAWAADTVPPPSAGLGSNHNYYLYNDGKPILGLVVAVEATKDIVCDDIGFHIQLNANSPETVQTNWQQYVMGFHPNFTEHGKKLGSVIGGSIEYFAKPDSFNTATGNRLELHGLPGPRTLPAGAKFTIELQYEGNDISGAKFTYSDSGNRNHRTWTIPVPPKSVSKAVRTPILAFQLDLVGRSGGDVANTKGGESNITYTASTPMTVVNKKPPSKGQTTAEKANSVYSQLPSGPSTTFTQHFSFVH